MALLDVPKARCIKVGSATLEQRRDEMPVPLNLRNILSQQQLTSVQQMPLFGWRLAFVRRAKNCELQVVVVNNRRDRFALLEQDGTINTARKISIRE